MCCSGGMGCAGLQNLEVHREGLGYWDHNLHTPVGWVVPLVQTNDNPDCSGLGGCGYFVYFWSVGALFRLYYI